MNLEKYELKSGEKLEVFELISVGKNGQISKMIQYTSTNYKDLYNLGFGDKNEIGEIDGTAVSNNGDSEKVPATVVATLYAFTDKHPKAMIYAIGSTKSRTRLYIMGISKYIELIREDFQIFGELENGWESFTKGIDYKGFLVQLKQ